ncbi:MAG: bifunctional diaminohydroxyphosphoribosylaminopyrimidine deaminase/5-amino-6-(5-phosphoribosylamino)uracil reductase RibD [Candidatus Omnitrophota bacterium]
MEKDVFFMRRTLKLAKCAEGCVSPNPLVGAVIVKKNKVISAGYHKKAGLPHAEIETIKKSKVSLENTTLYVNLEPCCHFGRTGPCADEIIKQGIKRVVIAAIDPTLKVNGKSIKKLRKAGIKVDVGLCKEEAIKLNEVFFKNSKTNRPFVVGKAAQSLDGKTATCKGASKWITTLASRNFSKSLRDKYDCVLIGANTLIKDNPRLDGIKKIPYKAVISNKLNLPLNSYVFKKNPEKLIVFTSNKSKNKSKKFPSSVKIFFLKDNKGFLPPKEILRILYDLGITSVFIEGGSRTLGHFFMSKLVDKAYFFISPKIIGGVKALTSIGAEGFPCLKICPVIQNIEIKRLDEDIIVSGYPHYNNP